MVVWTMIIMGTAINTPRTLAVQVLQKILTSFQSTDGLLCRSNRGSLAGSIDDTNLRNCASLEVREEDQGRDYR